MPLPLLHKKVGRNDDSEGQRKKGSSELDTTRKGGTRTGQEGTAEDEVG